MMLRLLWVFVVWGAVASSARAVDYRVEPLKEAAPADEISAEIAAALSPSGVRVIRGSETTLCDIWLSKELNGIPDFKPTSEVLYPLRPGQFVGVARFARKGSDFRDQDIESATYTLRYAQQPVDGAHVGTSLTRDFLLLSQAKKDTTLATLEYKPLTKQSAEAAGSSHPALLSMQRAMAAPDATPTIRHDEERDWWIVALQASVKPDDGEAKPTVIELVVVGVAAE